MPTLDEVLGGGQQQAAPMAPGAAPQTPLGGPPATPEEYSANKQGWANWFADPVNQQSLMLAGATLLQPGNAAGQIGKSLAVFGLSQGMGRQNIVEQDRAAQESQATVGAAQARTRQAVAATEQTEQETAEMKDTRSLRKRKLEQELNRIDAEIERATTITEKTKLESVKARIENRLLQEFGARETQAGIRLREAQAGQASASGEASRARARRDTEEAKLIETYGLDAKKRAGASTEERDKTGRLDFLRKYQTDLVKELEFTTDENARRVIQDTLSQTRRQIEQLAGFGPAPGPETLPAASVRKEAVPGMTAPPGTRHGQAFAQDDKWIYYQFNGQVWRLSRDDLAAYQRGQTAAPQAQPSNRSSGKIDYGNQTP